MIVESITPTQQDAKMAAEASDRLALSIRRQEAMGIGIGIGMEGQREFLALPPLIVQLLSQILEETASGHAVTVVPAQSELTTSEAANYLNVSRPYLTSLLEQGKIPFHRVGSHRRVRVADMTKYKKQQMAASCAAMAELQAQAEELGMEY